MLGIDAIFTFGSKVIDKIFPDPIERDKAKLAMLQLEQAGELEAIKLEYAAMAKQADTNIEEAKSKSVFVSGWRPGIGWVCGIGLLYSVLVQPILVACKVNAPVTDTSVLMQMLFALLGVAGLRTYERIKGVATDRIRGPK